MNPATRQHGPGTEVHADPCRWAAVHPGHDRRGAGPSTCVRGRVLWQAPAPVVQPQYHTAMSPVVDGGSVIVHVGGQDRGRADGVRRHHRQGPLAVGPAMVPPTARRFVVTLGGVRQVVTFTQQNFVGVSAADGSLLWRRPVHHRGPRPRAQTPVVHKDLVIESGRGNGITAFRADARGHGPGRRPMSGTRTTSPST